jgi:hypothetical protein
MEPYLDRNRNSFGARLYAGGCVLRPVNKIDSSFIACAGAEKRQGLQVLSYAVLSGAGGFDFHDGIVPTLAGLMNQQVGLRFIILKTGIGM